MIYNQKEVWYLIKKTTQQIYIRKKHFRQKLTLGYLCKHILCQDKKKICIYYLILDSQSKGSDLDFSIIVKQRWSMVYILDPSHIWVKYSLSLFLMGCVLPLSLMRGGGGLNMPTLFLFLKTIKKSIFLSASLEISN